MTDARQQSQPPGAEGTFTVPAAVTQGLATQEALARTGPSALSRSEVEDIHELLPYLSYSDGELTVEAIPATDLWDGSRPMLLYLPQRAVDNYRSIHAAFARYFDVSVCCPVKTCAIWWP